MNHRSANPRAAEQKPDFILGLDLGQSQDYTALAILERHWESRPDDASENVRHYALRHLKRWPLKTSYPEIVAEAGKLVTRPPLSWSMLAVDQTGVGLAIVDMLRQAQLQAHLRPIVITAGHEITQDNGVWHVPKKELVSTIQKLLQTRRIKFSPLPERELLVHELLNFKVKITLNANETFEAWRERDHDDLVFAVAMAAWLGETQAPFQVPEGISVPRSSLRERMAQGHSRHFFGYGR